MLLSIITLTALSVDQLLIDGNQLVVLKGRFSIAISILITFFATLFPEPSNLVLHHSLVVSHDIENYL
ncbi:MULTISPECIES: hypothetical protein [Aeromonas]|uniref:hypothetical protein n=1 Tax=Aeromonas TaxID=642 RepID=UPI00191E372F|nr:hypothetical protein [Aeromonas veronii]MBL0475846.1 hypothetical protein [Aeromonas veronii]MBL0591725.1 hypothetical protein [Aeromonas veronii]